MSRIPKFGASEPLDQNLTEKQVESVFKKPIQSNQKMGIKRPNDKMLVSSQKKAKIENNSNLANRAQVLSNVHSTSKHNAIFSEKAKKVALLAPSKNVMIRESMPAVVVKKHKRPAWDLKGRIQDMEEHYHLSQQSNEKMKQELELCKEKIAALDASNSQLHQEVETKSVQSEEATTKIKQLELSLKEKTQECLLLAKSKEDESNEFKTKIEVLSKELQKTKDILVECQRQHDQEIASFKSTISNITSLKSSLEAQLESFQQLAKNQKEEIRCLTEKYEEAISNNISLQKNYEILESKMREEEAEIRKLHNVVQELKGNIRVYCRMRPPLPHEIKNGMQVANIVPLNTKTLEIYEPSDNSMNDSTGKNQPKYEFSFDCIFPPSTSQEEIFDEISQLVQSSLDGYNVCIFAYGQTGSGKTFTMEGPENIVNFASFSNHPQKGIIPRSVQQIFMTVSKLEPKGWKYNIETTFLEIYNERIQDLLNSSQNEKTKCEIIKSGSKGSDILLSNVTTNVVTSASQVYELLCKARAKRAVAATKCNEYSSRSHYVFQMKLSGENSITSEKCDGTLNLIDLAGSERIKESESTGNRLTEAKAINKSLSNLGKVILSLSKKESYIPYRDSKLTHLLANYLGGNSKTLMLVNISPDNENLNETINSLRFAKQVNQCNIGTAQKRVK